MFHVEQFLGEFRGGGAETRKRPSEREKKKDSLKPL